MAIAMLVEFPKMTAEIYDEVLAEMMRDFGAPAGRTFHAAGPFEGGWRVFDVWEHQEQFDTFAKEQIGPISAKHGVTDPPKITRWPVHNQLP